MSNCAAKSGEPRQTSNTQGHLSLASEGTGGISLSSWSTEELLDALASFDQSDVGDDFVEISTMDYRLLRFPEHFLSPTMPAAQIVSSRTSRSLTDVFDEIAALVRSWGLDNFHWWVSHATYPADTEEFLLRRGGVVSDSIQILARELGDEVHTDSSFDGIHVELVCDERSLRAASEVETRGWGRSPLGEEDLERRLNEVIRDLEEAARFQFVAFINGEPVSTGCCRVEGEFGRLYGAVTLPEFRSRGAYRAILSARLRQVREVGATIALTRGRTLTSGRILARAGFRVHGEEKCYRVMVN